MSAPKRKGGTASNIQIGASREGGVGDGANSPLL